jgi:hypothetical protein
MNTGMHIRKDDYRCFLFVVGDGLNTCSFSAGRVRGSFSTSRFSDLGNMKPIQLSNDLGSNIRSLQGFSDSAWSFSSSFVSAVGGASSSFPTAAMNPNKAVFTIDTKSSKVMLFSYSEIQVRISWSFFHSF